MGAKKVRQICLLLFIIICTLLLCSCVITNKKIKNLLNENKDKILKSEQIELILSDFNGYNQVIINNKTYKAAIGIDISYSEMTIMIYDENDVIISTIILDQLGAMSSKRFKAHVFSDTSSLLGGISKIEFTAE